jgi:hypothetical protein
MGFNMERSEIQLEAAAAPIAEEQARGGAPVIYGPIEHVSRRHTRTLPLDSFE